MEAITTCAVKSLLWLWSVVNSNFAVGAFGAFGGAWCAHKIATTAKEKELLLEEIRNTNFVIMMALDICHSYLSLKGQYVKPLIEKYEKDKIELDEFLKKKEVNQNPEEIFHLDAHLQEISTFYIPIDILQKRALDKLLLNGRPLAVVSQLARCIHSLYDSLNERNIFINKLKSCSPIPPGELAKIYFGLPDSANNIDETYPALVKAIYQYTDGCIMYSSTLAEDLQKHGDNLHKQYKKMFGQEAPKINKVDFKLAEDKGLMPEKKDYENWFKMFKEEKDNG